MAKADFFGSKEGWRLDAAGASIDRIRLTTTTLHPQMLAWGSTTCAVCEQNGGHL